MHHIRFGYDKIFNTIEDRMGFFEIAVRNAEQTDKTIKSRILSRYGAPGDIQGKSYTDIFLDVDLKFWYLKDLKLWYKLLIKWLKKSYRLKFIKSYSFSDWFKDFPRFRQSVRFWSIIALGHVKKYIAMEKMLISPDNCSNFEDEYEKQLCSVGWSEISVFLFDNCNPCFFNSWTDKTDESLLYVDENWYMFDLEEGWSNTKLIKLLNNWLLKKKGLESDLKITNI